MGGEALRSWEGLMPQPRQILEYCDWCGWVVEYLLRGNGEGDGMGVCGGETGKGDNI